MTKDILVSIVVVSHNVQMLSRTIESCLDQAHKNIEIIIIDRSNKGKIEEDFFNSLMTNRRVLYYKNKDINFPQALNYGFDRAKGDYFTWINSGNEYFPEAIEVMLNELLLNKGIGMVYAGAETSNGENEDISNISELCQKNCIGSCFLYRKTCYDEIGKYNENLYLSVVYDYWIRLWKKFIICKIDKVLFKNNIFEEMSAKIKQSELIVQYKYNIIDDVDLINVYISFLKKARFIDFYIFMRDYRMFNSYKFLIKQILILSISRGSVLFSLAREFKQKAGLLYKSVKSLNIKHGKVASSFELQKKINSRKCKIGMAVLAYERPEVLKICLDSLFKTNLYDYDITFLIQDDGSINPIVRTIIEQERAPQYKIIRYYTSKGPNSWGAAFNKAMHRLLEIDDFDIIGSCDSDALFHPEWLDKTMKICMWAKANHKEHILGPFSSFNSSDVGFHGVLGTYKSPDGNYVVKRRMGAVNYFYYKEDFLKLGFFAESKDDESLMTANFEKLNVRNFSTETSYVEHIGKWSILDQWRPTPVGENIVYGLNLVKFGWSETMKKYSPKGYYKYIKDNQFNQMGLKSDLPVDVVIPVTEKDLGILPLTLTGLRENLKHPINQIRIIAPHSPKIVEFCSQYQCKYVDENECSPIRKEDIHYKYKDWNRSGWLLQQFLKWSECCSESENYLVLDSDTVFIRPHVFELRGKTVFFYSDERHQPYYDFYYKILGNNIGSPLSFVAHNMLFNKIRLGQLKDYIEQRHQDTWYNVICKNIIPWEPSGFSEYETYGNWMLANYSQEVDKYYWSNLPCSRKEETMNYEILKKKYSKEYRAISFHSYL